MKRCNYTICTNYGIVLHCLTLFSKIVGQRAKNVITPINTGGCVSHCGRGTEWDRKNVGTLGTAGQLDKGQELNLEF